MLNTFLQQPCQFIDPYQAARGAKRSRSATLALMFMVISTLIFAALLSHGALQAQSLPAKLLDKSQQALPAAPAARSGPLPPAVQRALALAKVDLLENNFPIRAVKAIGASGDARMAWYLFDLLRFARENQLPVLVEAFEKITRVKLPADIYTGMGDYLLAWNLPAPPGYREMKRDVYLLIEPRWARFFDDASSTIDWRQVGWGGVFIDDRPDATRSQICPRGCIPALDQPKVTPASEGDWYPKDAIVFGVVINGEARAYPKNMMEIHEMVNDTLGGRQIGMPYCTLCLSVQAYYTDRVSANANGSVASSVPSSLTNSVTSTIPLLRTSGLLSRSNKLMYDVRTGSVIDTFTGEAKSGPLLKAGVTLPQATVVISTWGAWRAAHPKTTILAQDGGIGRSYPANPLRGRDDQGPIFPVGDVDPRLPVHEVVLGVTNAQGQALAFSRANVQLALAAGEPVRLGGIEVRAEAGGLRAYAGGSEITSQQAFWFAWSQFKPKTLLWKRGG